MKFVGFFIHISLLIFALIMALTTTNSVASVLWAICVALYGACLMMDIIDLKN